MNVTSLNLKVNLKDDTGYLIGCRLFGDAAERVLGCTAAQFQVLGIKYYEPSGIYIDDMPPYILNRVHELQAMKFPEREGLKWKYALEKCDIRLHILGPTSAFPNAVYNILSIVRDEDEDDATQLLGECAHMDDY